MVQHGHGACLFSCSHNKFTRNCNYELQWSLLWTGIDCLNICAEFSSVNFRHILYMLAYFVSSLLFQQFLPSKQSRSADVSPTSDCLRDEINERQAHSGKYGSLAIVLSLSSSIHMNKVYLIWFLSLLGHFEHRMQLPYESIKENSVCCSNEYVFVRGGSSIENEHIHIYR